MGLYALLLAGHVVLGRAVFGVTNHRLRFGPGIGLVLFHQAHPLAVFSNAAGRRFHRRDHALSIIDSSMMVIARTGSISPVAHHGGVGISSADHPVVDSFVTGWRS